jgi:transcriptional regulator GlxA family with amidase domain
MAGLGHTIQWMRELHGTFGSTLPILDALTDAVVFECQRKPDALGEERMAHVRSYIYQAGSEALTVSKLAEVAHMSERHFTREFQRRTSMTPMTYVRKIRLEKASNAISQTDLPLREIAHDVGFRDEFEFSRVFRRVMGYAPSALRARTRPAFARVRSVTKQK